jgi:hypothetical protein
MRSDLLKSDRHGGRKQQISLNQRRQPEVFLDCQVTGVPVFGARGDKMKSTRTVTFPVR